MAARVAALHDIHGNLPALDAVLADVEREGVEAIVCGGDVAAGPMPEEVLERLAGLGDRVRYVMGNGDRELIAPARAGDDVWGRRLAFAAGRLSDAGRRLMAPWPASLALDVAGLGPVRFCHGSPRSDEEIVTSLTPPERLRPMLAGVEEATVVLGHTHVQFDRVVDDVRWVNAGSVGMPYEREPGAYWLLLGPSVDLRRTAYDLDAAAEAIRAAGYPEAEEAIADLRRPPGPEEASEYFERQAQESEAGGGG
jgi:predicted phosphodiesterase